MAYTDGQTPMQDGNNPRLTPQELRQRAADLGIEIALDREDDILAGAWQLDDALRLLRTFVLATNTSAGPPRE